eukprot:766073-Hanusia_phi.AAC.3
MAARCAASSVRRVSCRREEELLDVPGALERFGRLSRSTRPELLVPCAPDGLREQGLVDRRDIAPRRGDTSRIAFQL